MPLTSLQPLEESSGLTSLQPLEDEPTKLTSLQAAPLTSEQDQEARYSGRLAIAPSIPIPAFLEDYLVRAGRRFSEGTEALANVPANLGNLVTGGGPGRLQSGLQAAQGLGYGLGGQMLAPFEAAAEQATAGLGAPEAVAEQVGNFSTIPLTIGAAALQRSGKMGQGAQDMLDVLLGSGKTRDPNYAQPATAFPEGPMAQGTQLELPGLPATAQALDPAETAARIAQAEAEQAVLKRDASFQTSKKGTQREIFETDPLYTPPPPQLGEREIAKMNWLARHEGPESAANYLAGLGNKQPPTRTLDVGAKILGGGGTDRSKLSQMFEGFRASDPTLPYLPSNWGLLLRKMGQSSSEMVEGFGPAGKQLVSMVKQVYDRHETDLARFLDGPQGVTHLANRMKLTKSERENIVDVMEGIAPAVNPRVEQLTSIMKSQSQAIEQRATGLLEIRDPVSGAAIPWRPRENYFPHFVDFDAVTKDKARTTKMVQEIQMQESALRVQKGQPAIGMQEAQEIFNHMRRNSRQEYGHLEVARHFSFSDYERDGIAAWSKYIEGSLKRMTEAEAFGRKDQNVVGLVNQIGLTAGDDAAFAANKFMTQVLGRDPLTHITSTDNNATSAIKAVRSLQVGFKLGQAVIANASQSNLTGIVTGYKNLVRGFMELQTQGGKDFGRLAGATIEQTMRDMNDAMGVGKFGTKVLELTGFSRVEQFNRMLAANSGKAFANDLIGRLTTATGRKADTYKRHLRAMGIEPMDVIARGGKLTPEEEIRAGRSVIERTQFKVRPQELPLYWNGPMGKLVTQFSSFGFKAAKAINDEVIKEVRQGNYAPLARFLLVTPVVGEVFADIQSVAKGGKDRPEDALGRLVDNYASVGAFGLFHDAFRATGYGEVGALRRLVGPTLSDAAQIAAGFRDPKMLAKLALQNIPIVGPALRPMVFPPKKKTDDDDED
jgi:hypothetical protein